MIGWTDSNIERLMQQFSSDILRISKGGIEATLWSIKGPFGFIKSSGIAPIKETTALEMTESNRLLKSVELALKRRYSREWESSYEKSILSTLALFRKPEFSNFENQAELNSAHLPSFMSLLIGSLETLDQVFQKWPLKADTYYPWEDSSRDPYLSYNVIVEMIDSVPKVSPLDNILVKPEKAKPCIRSLGIDFFKDVVKLTKSLTREEVEESLPFSSFYGHGKSPLPDWSDYEIDPKVQEQIAAWTRLEESMTPEFLEEIDPLLKWIGED